LLGSIDVFRDQLVEKARDKRNESDMMIFRQDAFRKVVPVPLASTDQRPQYYRGLFARRFMHTTAAREPSLFPSAYIELSHSENQVNLFLGSIDENLAFKIIELIKSHKMTE